MDKSWKYNTRPELNPIFIFVSVVIILLDIFFLPILIINWSSVSIIPLILLVGMTFWILLQWFYNMKILDDYLTITDNLLILKITPLFSFGVRPTQCSILFSEIENIDLMQYKVLTIKNFRLVHISVIGLTIREATKKITIIPLRFSQSDNIHIFTILKTKTTIGGRLAKYVVDNKGTIEKIGKGILSVAKEFSKKSDKSI